MIPDTFHARGLGVVLDEPIAPPTFGTSIWADVRQSALPVMQREDCGTTYDRSHDIGLWLLAGAVIVALLALTVGISAVYVEHVGEAVSVEGR